MERNFTVNDIITILLKRLWLIITMALLSGLIAFIYSQYILPKKYTATIKLYVYNQKDGQVNQTLTANDFALSGKLVNTYMVILKSDTVLNSVSSKIGKLGLNYSANEIRSMITAKIVDETEVFEVKITAGNPEDAKIIADAIEQVAPPEIIRVVRAGAVETVDKATLPEKHSSPNIPQNTIISIVIGLVLACGLAFVLELMNTSVKSKEELAEQYKLPVLAVIPNLNGSSSSSRYGGRYYYSYGYGSNYESRPAAKEGEKKQ